MNKGIAMRTQDLSLAELRDLAEAAATVAAGAELGVFQALAEGPATPEALARRLHLDERGTRSLLPALMEAGFLEEVGRDGAEEGGTPRYQLTDRARRELADPDSPDYQAGGLPLWLDNLQAWTRLPEAVRTGRPLRAVGDAEAAEDPEERRERIARFMAGMAASPRERLERLAAGVLRRHPDARTMLDVGGGPGHIARVFVERGLRATVLDTPETMEYVREAYGLDAEEAIEPVGADFLTDPLPEGPFDVTLLSNVLHMLDPKQNAALLRRVREVTAPGGLVAVADFVRGRSRRGGRFGLVMLLRTEGGGTYTVDEHRGWFEDAGFGDLEVEDLDPERQLLTAVARP